MDTTWVIGLILFTVVGFFAYQWWAKSRRRRAPGTATPPAGIEPVAPAPLRPEIKEEKMPAVPGQTEAELRTPEPLQRREPVVTQEPVTHDGLASAEFRDTLRHPEQSFHQPQGPAPTMQISDVPAGRAAAPMGGAQQVFSPEMAQNGGVLMGNGVFAYDGMEADNLPAF